MLIPGLSFTLLVVASLSLLTGAEGGGRTEASSPAHCLTDSDAEVLSEDFAWMVASWALNVTKSEQILLESVSPTVHDWSGSVRNIGTAGCTSEPQPIAEDRDTFAALQLTVPPFEFHVLKVWHSCDAVTFRWRAPLARNVTGLVLLETVYSARESAPPARIIQTIYSEFDSAAFLAVTGDFIPVNCTTATARF